MFLRRGHLAFAAILMLAVACDDAVLDPTRSGILAAQDSAAQDSAAQFQTDATTYAFTTTSVGTEGRIRATLSNRSGRAMYLVNCHGGTSLSLQRLDGARWRPFWSPVILDCLSAPITVPPGGTHTFDIRVFAGNAGSNDYPQFERPLETGLYRVIWHDAYFSYQDRLGWGTPVPEALRASNSFQIIAP